MKLLVERLTEEEGVLLQGLHEHRPSRLRLSEGRGGFFFVGSCEPRSLFQLCFARGGRPCWLIKGASFGKCEESFLLTGCACRFFFEEPSRRGCFWEDMSGLCSCSNKRRQGLRPVFLPNMFFSVFRDKRKGRRRSKRTGCSTLGGRGLCLQISVGPRVFFFFFFFFSFFSRFPVF